MATDRIDFFNAKPHNELLLQREENEAYCRAVPGKDYLVYFPGPGEVELDMQDARTDFRVEQLEIMSGEWIKLDTELVQGNIRLTSSGQHQIFIIQ
jgi:hypothetical protein